MGFPLRQPDGLAVERLDVIKLNRSVLLWSFDLGRQAESAIVIAQGSVPLTKADKKAAAILAAARLRFYRDGYGATSVDEIGKTAGIGKATIYKYFGSKEKLFGAVVAQENRVGLEVIGSLLTQKGALKDRMAKAGLTLLDLLVAPDFVASYRMVMAEATRLPQLATLYYEGAAQLLGVVSAAFETLVDRGELSCPDPLRAAEQFVGLIRGDLQLRALLGLPAASGASRHDIVKSGVAVFLAAYDRAR